MLQIRRASFDVGGGRSTYGTCDFALSSPCAQRVDDGPLRCEVSGRCGFANDYAYSSD